MTKPTAPHSTLPYPPLLLRVFRSSVLVWLLVRIIYVVVLTVGIAFFGLLSPEEGIQSALYPAWPLRLLLVVLTAVVVHLDRTRAHEHLLQANLGVPAAWFRGASLVAAGLSDLTVQWLLGVL